MTATKSAPQTSKIKSITAWVIQSVLAFIFLGAAVSKLAGVKAMVDMFATIGFGQWFRYVTGTVEVLGVIALLVPGFAVVGALWLGTTMVFAILTHLLILHTNPTMALVLLVLAGVVVWLRKDQITAIRAKLA